MSDVHERIGRMSERLDRRRADRAEQPVRRLQWVRQPIRAALGLPSRASGKPSPFMQGLADGKREGYDLGHAAGYREGYQAGQQSAAGRA
jgi:flagellar biosynthesis/type III secretory pathway protein FliH